MLLLLLLLLQLLLLFMRDRGYIRMGMDGENANASEASNFRMRAAASGCVTVETCRRAESLPLCRSVWRIRVPCRKLPMTAGRAYSGS